MSAKLMEKNKESFCQTCKVSSGLSVKCYECKKVFCFHHSWGGQVCDGMDENEKVRDVCDKCKKDFDYFHVGDRRVKKNKK